MYPGIQYNEFPTVYHMCTSQSTSNIQGEQARMQELCTSTLEIMCTHLPVCKQTCVVAVKGPVQQGLSEVLVNMLLCG